MCADWILGAGKVHFHFVSNLLKLCAPIPLFPYSLIPLFLSSQLPQPPSYPATRHPSTPFWKIPNHFGNKIGSVTRFRAELGFFSRGTVFPNGYP